MATVLQTHDPTLSLTPVTPPTYSSTILDADAVLRSCDSQTFRVLKLYVIRSFTVLGKLIQVASITSKSSAADSASAGTRLPEVQLSDSSAIFPVYSLCLLAFIFPVPSVLHLDEKTDRLSVAQKYEMSSVTANQSWSMDLKVYQ
ncbi:hypothetical protein EDB84DRAFT_1564974 [Lactarius hengduanensis]|nr:hypothetical protein EDB84DRAFT_1564974 [Lactarius hengduanensis]